MKRNIMKLTGIAMISALAFTACHKEKVKEDPLLAGLLSYAIRSAGAGNCAISVNLTGLYYGSLEQLSISGALAGVGVTTEYASFITHYNNVTGAGVSVATLAAQPYNKKYDAFYTDSGSWNDAARAAYLSAFAANGTVASAGVLGTVSNARGTGILACGRIPRSSCSISGLGTADRATDIKNQVAVIDTLLNNNNCKKSTGDVINSIKATALRGLPTDVTATLTDGVFTNVSTNGATLAFSSSDTNGTAGVPNYTHQEGNAILGEKAYPKVGALVSLGFGQLMPARAKGDTATAYALSSSAYTKGTNIAFTTVDSCEAIGLGSTGFVPTSTKFLTPTKEIVYAFSTNGTAAAVYASAAGANLVVTTKPVAGVASTTAADIQKVNDAYACNTALRSATVIPMAVGGGKLDTIQAVSGDGNNSALLTACVYGGSSSSRTIAAAVVSAADDSGLPAALASIASCPAGAKVGAATFADTGLQTLSDFPNN